jgi:isopenicillin-N epimerase
VPGGFGQLLAQNHALTLEARAILCARIGATPSGPESMTGTMATLILPGNAWAAPESLYRRLLDEQRIQVPIFTVPGRSERALRVSAHVYNSRDDYERLAQALSA